jgi:branched-chain amino acid transport system permease protein
VLRSAKSRFALAALAAAVFPFACGLRPYLLFVVAEFAVFAIVALGLDLLIGRSGQISLGHNGFFAVGAYTAAILVARLHVDLAVALIAAPLLAAIVSLVLGLPATRLRGHYLAIATLGFGIAVAQIALKWTALTNGDEGVHLNAPHLAALAVGSPLALYALAFIALAAVAYFSEALPRTRLGRSFAAVRDSEVAAEAMGVAVARTKVTAFAISAAIAGIGGALYAALTGFVAPEDFGVSQTLLFFSIVIVGGTASTAGTIVAAFVLDAVAQAAATVSGLPLVLIGGTIVAVALFRPGGLKSLLPGRATT